MNTLFRENISLRDSEAGRRFVSAYTAAGLAIVALRDGARFILVHVNSGYSLTPLGWFFEQFKQASACVRFLVNRFGKLFEGDVRSIQTLATEVLQAHRDAAAFTGRYHYLRQMNALFDDEAFERRMEELRGQGKPWAFNEVAA